MGMDSVRHRYKRLHEMPFSSDNKYMTVTVTARDKPQVELTFVKGAVERVLKMCNKYEHTLLRITSSVFGPLSCVEIGFVSGICTATTSFLLALTSFVCSSVSAHAWRRLA